MWKSVKPLLKYDDCLIFFKMAAVRHLGFVVFVFGPPTDSIVGGFITLQNLVGTWNRCNSFGNMEVLIFNEFFLRMLIRPPRWRFGGFDPLNREQLHRDSQSAHP